MSTGTARLSAAGSKTKTTRTDTFFHAQERGRAVPRETRGREAAGYGNRCPMLILTRKAGESLHLGDDIKITVFSVQGKQVKLGISVPEDMMVYRDEVYQRIKDENRQAMQTSDNDLLAVTRLWQTQKK